MGVSADECEQGAPERVFIEPPLSFAVLESLLPIGRGELEDSVFRPVRQEVEEVAEVTPRLDSVQLAAGDQRNENGIGNSAVFGADKEPVLTAQRLPEQVSLRNVVRHGQAAVVEETLECFLLVEGVPDRGGERRLVQDEIFLG